MVILSTSSITGLQMQVLPFLGTGDYTLEVRSTPLEIQSNACSNPMAEREPGTTFVNNTFAMAQHVGTVTANGCLQISGRMSVAADPAGQGFADLAVSDVDIYRFTTVGNDLLIFVLTPNNPSNDVDLRVRAPDFSNTPVLRCEGAITPEVCAFQPSARVSGRTLLVSVIPFTVLVDDYILDLISASRITGELALPEPPPVSLPPPMQPPPPKPQQSVEGR